MGSGENSEYDSVPYKTGIQLKKNSYTEATNDLEYEIGQAGYLEGALRSYEIEKTTALDFEEIPEYISFDIETQKKKKVKVGMIKKSTDQFEENDIAYFGKAISSLVTETDSDIILAPEYNFLTECGPLPEDRKDEIIDMFKSVSKLRDVLIFPGSIVWKNDKGEMRNTAPIIHDGEIVLEYDKRHDGGEEAIAKAYGLTPKYGDTPGIFSWKGHDCGVEVCADHYYGALKKETRDLDFQFIISCQMSIAGDRVVAKKGGHVLICDGYYNNAEVRKSFGKGMTNPIRPSKVKTQSISPSKVGKLVL